MHIRRRAERECEPGRRVQQREVPKEALDRRYIVGVGTREIAADKRKSAPDEVTRPDEDGVRKETGGRGGAAAVQV